ncbi:polysaccharide lyase [Streptomyces sp. NPDC091217]|uniref:polysaccharide lyase n=1 Tax=Streptomyces sp. NPDC091217 TaxID=3365975 RepID=UPI00381A71B8
MRRRRSMALCAAAALITLAACSGPSTDHERGDGDSGGRSAAPHAGPTTALSDDADGVQQFFGPTVRPVDRGSFGLSRAVFLPRRDPKLGQVLRVRYPAGSASPTVARKFGRPEGGAQLYLPLKSGPADSLHLRYYLRFPREFDFVKGGKLPGLYGGTVTSGRRIPDGADGLSTRYMWRLGGAAEVYAYLPTSVQHGTSLDRGAWRWPTGRWVCVEQAVRLNTPGRSDGTVDVTVDNRTVLHAGGLEFRTTNALGIDGIFFSTFFGGSDPSWATPRGQYADFAGFAVSTRPIGPLSGA